MFPILVHLFLITLQAEDWQQYGGLRRDFTSQMNPPSVTWNIAWRQPIGPGTSQVVGDGTCCYTMYMKLKPGSKVEGEEIVTCRELATGKLIWEQVRAVSRLKGQETFSGDPIRPQATPALHQDCLCTLGYTGLLTGWQAKTGKALWQIDLVKDLGATPVQFGFASSPLIYQNDFIVHVGGSQTTLIRLDALNGQVKWKAEPGQPSYASPTLADLAGQVQFVQVTRDAILGIDPSTGKTLWKYSMPEQGLTNVPTPLVFGADKLLVSGQGIKGTRLLQFTRKSEKWYIQEVWQNTRVTFFYCNWQIIGNSIFGNANDILVALDLKDGKELWRERGFPKSNQLQLGDDHLILDGDGKLHQCKLSSRGLQKVNSLSLMNAGCWTAPSRIGEMVLARDQAEIVALQPGGK